jgi:hypothetical protein
MEFSAAVASQPQIASSASRTCGAKSHNKSMISHHRIVLLKSYTVCGRLVIVVRVAPVV